jgi:hypothetical protein
MNDKIKAINEPMPSLTELTVSIEINDIHTNTLPNRAKKIPLFITIFLKGLKKIHL